jgi:hypothetical protein
MIRSSDHQRRNASLKLILLQKQILMRRTGKYTKHDYAIFNPIHLGRILIDYWEHLQELRV